MAQNLFFKRYPCYHFRSGMNYHRFIFGGNTKLLFRFLIRNIQPDLILDIGSRDGNDSLHFRLAAPNSNIIAFEANPELFSKMKKNHVLDEKNIQVLPYAVTDTNGTLEFSIFNEAKGTGSLKRRADKDLQLNYTVEGRRLDHLFESTPHKKIALWIDVEGNCFETIQGAASIFDRIVFIHIEAETRQIFVGQKLMQDTFALLEQNGFINIAGKIPTGRHQGDFVFIKKTLVNNLPLILAYNRTKPRRWLVDTARKMGFL